MQQIEDGAAERRGLRRGRRRRGRRRGEDAPQNSGEDAVSELRLALSRATRLVARRLEKKLGSDDLARAALELDRLTRAAGRLEKLEEARRSEGPQTLAEWMLAMEEEFGPLSPAGDANGSENKDGNDTARMSSAVVSAGPER